MISSAEVRWFLPGTPSAGVVSSFLGHGDVSEERRADLYLCFEGNDSLGFKLRELGPTEAALELKVRSTPERLLQFRDGPEGYASRWVKWSSPRVGSSLALALAAADDGWIRVEKARRLRKVAMDGESLLEVGPSGHLQEGCAYELATLRVEGSDWWTVALEAFGRPQLLDAHLRLAGDWFFARCPPLMALTREHSSAYPSWLAARR